VDALLEQNSHLDQRHQILAALATGFGVGALCAKAIVLESQAGHPVDFPGVKKR
jgi:hypothetical protein